MRVALTGASGGLDGAILAALSQSGHEVISLGRTASGPDFRYVSLSDASSIAAVLPEVDLVVHAAGKAVGTDSDFAENELLCAALGSVASSQRLPIVNLSSLSVFGDAATPQTTDNSPCSPVTKYGMSKLRCERILDNSKATVCHLRVGNVYSPQLWRSVSDHRLRRLLKSGEITNLVFAEDVADVVRYLANRPPHTWPSSANVVRPGLGDQSFGSLLSHGPSKGWRTVVPPVVPHLIRRALGVNSVRGDSVYRIDALREIGYQFQPVDHLIGMRTTTPSEEADEDNFDFGNLSILHFTNTVDKQLGAGLASRGIDMCEQLAHRGARTTLLSTGLKDSKVIDYQENGVRYVRLPSRYGRFFLPSSGVFQLRNLVREHNVVQLVGHWSFLNVVIAWICRREGVPYVVCPAGSLKVWGRSILLKRVFNTVAGTCLVQNAAGWIAVVESELPEFVPYGVLADRIDIIPNGFEPDTPQAERLEKLETGTQSLPERYVLFLGRLNPIKGPDILLDAFVRVAEKLTFDLVFAGQDEGLMESLETYAASNDVAHRVHFLGFVDGAAKERVLSACSVLAIPSRKEAMSIVVLDAARFSKPVIATTNCGLDDLLLDDPDWLVEATGPELANALLLLEETDLELTGEQLAARAAELYGWDSVAKKYLHLYRRVIRK